MMKNDQLLSITERLLPYAMDFPEPARELLCEFVLTGEVPEAKDDLFYHLRVLLRAAGHGDNRSSDMDKALPLRYYIGVWLMFALEDTPELPDPVLEQMMDELEQRQPL